LLEQKENLYRGFLFQEFIQNTGDVRVVVMGDKVIGSFKRYNANSFKNNISTG
jgi:glutathione synthase/RimK-type ligase-like ATP-grasp enzyme